MSFFVLSFRYQTFRFDPWIGPYQMLLLRNWEISASGGNEMYSASPKAPALLKGHHQIV